MGRRVTFLHCQASRLFVRLHRQKYVFWERWNSKYNLQAKVFSGAVYKGGRNWSRNQPFGIVRINQTVCWWKTSIRTLIAWLHCNACMQLIFKSEINWNFGSAFCCCKNQPSKESWDIHGKLHSFEILAAVHWMYEAKRLPDVAIKRSINWKMDLIHKKIKTLINFKIKNKENKISHGRGRKLENRFRPLVQQEPIRRFIMHCKLQLIENLVALHFRLRQNIFR